MSTSIPYERHPGSEPYYRLLRDAEGIHVVCLQWFDEPDYDPAQWVEERVYTDRDAAESVARTYRTMDKTNDSARWRAFVADLLRYVDHTDDCSQYWVGRDCSCGLDPLVREAEEALRD